jgi:hypothetical protein
MMANLNKIMSPIALARHEGHFSMPVFKVALQERKGAMKW